MNLCNEIVTVFNSKFDQEADKDVYHGTVITGVSWFCEIVSTVDQGLKAANRFTVRIPEDADFGGKRYVSPAEYASTADVEELFTLANGDVIVKGIIEGPIRPKDMHGRADALTILGVTDNRRARAPHWKVVGS